MCARNSQPHSHKPALHPINTSHYITYHQYNLIANQKDDNVGSKIVVEEIPKEGKCYKKGLSGNLNS